MHSTNKPAVPFLIRFTQPVVFRDQSGAVRNEFNVGDTFEATHDTGVYFITCIGGIYHDEAERV